MTQGRDETQIRQLFRELKRQEERTTPSFSRDWEEARSRHRPVRLFPRSLKIATGVAVMLVVVFTLPFFRSDFVRLPEQDPQEVYSVAEWGLLTDSLLAIPCDQLLTTVPQLEYLNQGMGIYPSEQEPRNNGSTS